MPNMKHVPGCKCCDCEVLTDLFDRASSTNVGAGYTEQAGDWSIVDFGGGQGSLLIQDDNARLSIDTANGSADGILSVSFYPFDDDDEIIIYVDYTDADNYHYAKFTAGNPNGCVELYARSGGTDTLLAAVRAAIPPDQFTTVYLYWGERTDGNTELVAYIPLYAENVEAVQVSAFVDSFTTDAKSLGTGAITTAVYFDSLIIWKHYSDTNTACSQAPNFCYLEFDSFDGFSEVGCSWEQDGGAWSISADIGSGSTDDATTSTSGAMLISRNEHPSDTGRLSLTCAVLISAVGSSAKLWIGHEKLYLKVTVSDTDEITTQLIDAVAGALEDPQTVAQTSATNAYLTVTLCYDGETVVYTVSFTSRLVAGSAQATVDVTGKAAIEFDGSGGGSLRLSYAILSKSDDACGGCRLLPPSSCCSGTVDEDLPPVLRLEFPGPVFADNKCNTCESATTGAILLVQSANDPCLYEATCCACNSWADGLTQADLEAMDRTDWPGANIPDGCGLSTNNPHIGDPGGLGGVKIGAATLTGNVKWLFSLKLKTTHPAFPDPDFNGQWALLTISLYYDGSQEPADYEDKGVYAPEYTYGGLGNAFYALQLAPNFLTPVGPCLDKFPMVLDFYSAAMADTGQFNVSPTSCQWSGDLTESNVKTCVDHATPAASVTIWNDA